MLKVKYQKINTRDRSYACRMPNYHTENQVNIWKYFFGPFCLFAPRKRRARSYSANVAGNSTLTFWIRPRGPAPLQPSERTLAANENVVFLLSQGVRDTRRNERRPLEKIETCVRNIHAGGITYISVLVLDLDGFRYIIIIIYINISACIYCTRYSLTALQSYSIP